jgi:hypothetical protein
MKAWRKCYDGAAEGGNAAMAITENTSGQGKAATVPAEIDRWNWGAFLLNWIWGLGNGTFIALLALVPFVGFVMIFVLGAKGSAWAWRNRKWDSVEHFRHVQRIWGFAGLAVLVAVVLLAVVLYFSVTSILKSSEAYRLGVEALNGNAQAVQLLGPPITTGSPSGNISVNGSGGDAQLDFAVTGSKATGTIELKATKHFGAWKLDREELKVEGQPNVIELAK